MFKRQIGDAFQIVKENKIYTLKVYEANHKSRPGLEKTCEGCFFAKRGPSKFYKNSYDFNCTQTEEDRHITGECTYFNNYYQTDVVDAIFVVDSVRDLTTEITKNDITELCSSIKSIGDSLKLIEAFKQLSEQQKENKT